MIFASEGNSGEFVNLMASDLNYLGPKDLTQYFIRETFMNNTLKGHVQLEVILGRRLLGTILTVYIPTILLVVIAHMTNYFKPFFFEAVVTVNLTVMLVNSNLIGFLKAVYIIQHYILYRSLLQCLYLCLTISLKHPT